MSQNALVVFPGRGSYRPEHLGTITTGTEALKAADAVRFANKKKSISALDGMKKYSAKWHIAGEHASLLTAAYSLSDFERISKTISISAICGNSMGWYTALGASGALSVKESFQVIDQMGAYQVGNQIGGQLIYPLQNPDWTLNLDALAKIESLIQEIQGLYWSINLGYQAVLGGSAEAIKAAISALPKQQIGAIEFPLKLPLHSAFHTPYMKETSYRAFEDMSDLSFKHPSVPLFDGRGHHWRPRTSSEHELKEYTFGAQVHKAYDFRLMIQSAVQEYAPDIIILPGPGDNLGGAIAQSLIDIQWRGLRCKNDFIERQQSSPFLISMARPEQCSLVTD
jgi:[acyl-carrier-protein] S-malonyltransferase